jgi:hypothetical protein
MSPHRSMRVVDNPEEALYIACAIFSRLTRRARGVWSERLRLSNAYDDAGNIATVVNEAWLYSAWVYSFTGGSISVIDSVQNQYQFDYAYTATFHYKTISTDVASDDVSVPANFALLQNYPNPFNPSTTIRYALPHLSHVTVTVFNTLGQQVATMVNDEIEAGYYEVQFNAEGLASGVYFYRLHAGDYVARKRLLVLK